MGIWKGYAMVMKYFACLAVIALSSFTTSVTTVAPATEVIPAKQTQFAYPHVKRPNLLVADLDRSLEIYRDILGFDDATIGTSATDSYSYPVFNIPREARMRYVYLGEPGEDRVLGLTEVSGIELPRPEDRPFMSTIVIGVSGLDRIMARLDALGLEMTEPRVSGGAEFEFTEVSFVDPDGHMIVLYEVLG